MIETQGSTSVRPFGRSPGRERLRIALVAPAWFPVPSRRYGGTERVVSALADGLVGVGHAVTLFASGGSHTRARLCSAYAETPTTRLGDETTSVLHAAAKRPVGAGMSRGTRTVVAAIDATDADAAVLSTARALASLLRADVEAVHVLEDGGERARTDAACADIRFTTVHGRPVSAAIKLRAQSAGVVALVVGGHPEADPSHLAGHVALRLITELDKPVVLAPPAATNAGDIRRLLVPLDGARATADALSEMIEAGLEAVAEVTLLHVHEPAELPLFTEQPQHERPIWSREFIIRSRVQPERVQLELRVGAPEEHLLDVADQVGADLIVLGWRQDLAEGHAAVVREAMTRARIPIMLLPISAGSFPSQDPGRF